MPGHESSHRTLIRQQPRPGRQEAQRPRQSGTLVPETRLSQHPKAFRQTENVTRGTQQESDRGILGSRGTDDTRVVGRQVTTATETPRIFTQREALLERRLYNDFVELDIKLQILLQDMARRGSRRAQQRGLYPLGMTAREINRVAFEPRETVDIQSMAELIGLYQQYKKQYGNIEGDITSWGRTSETLRLQALAVYQSYTAFQTNLQRVITIPGLEREIERHRIARQEADERERQQREAAQWVDEIIVYPPNSDSRIRVGDTIGPWVVLRINRDGHLIAANLRDRRESYFDFDGWFLTKPFAEIAEGPWRNVVTEFFYGILEGFGTEGVGDFLQAMSNIEEMLTALVQAVSDPVATFNGLLAAIWDWYQRFAKGSDIERARQIGRVIGNVLFEIFLSKGLGRIVMLTRAREGLGILRRGSMAGAIRFGRRAAQLSIPLKKALRTLAESNRLSLANRIIDRAGRRAIQVARGSIRVSGQMIRGTLYVTERAYYVVMDGAERFVANLGARLDQWAFEEALEGGVRLSALGAGTLDQAAAALWRLIRRLGVSRAVGRNLYDNYLRNGFKPRGRFRAIKPDLDRYPTVEIRPNGDILGSYSDTLRYAQEAGLTGRRRRSETTFEAHHLLEQSYLERWFSIEPRGVRSIVLEASDHGLLSGEMTRTLSRRQFYDIDDFYNAHVEMYQNLGRSEWNEEIKGIIRVNRNRIRRQYERGGVPGGRGRDFQERKQRVLHFLERL